MIVETLEEPPATEPARRVIDGIRRIVRALRESSRALETEVGLTGAQVFVLQALRGERAMCLNDLAARTLTHQSSVSVVVSRLVERGLVRRVRSKDDARRLELALTQKGRSIVARVPSVEQQRMLEGLALLSAAQLRGLDRGLSAWVEAMGLPGGTPPMFFEEPTRRRSTPRAQRSRGGHE